MATKSEGGSQHPASHYLIVGDAEKPGTWHLRVKGTDGKPDHRLMGDAWAALHEGWRGNKYEGPDKEEAIRKLASLYKEEGMEPPSHATAGSKTLGIAAGVVFIPLASVAPGEKVMLMPIGRIPSRDGRKWVLKDPGAVITETKALLMDLPLDYDHQTDFAAVPGVGGTAPAAGWIKPGSLETRSDGIWGAIEYTRRGGLAVEEKEYRYLSPVFGFDKKTGEVTVIYRVALTNNPDLYMAAIASRQDSENEGENEMEGLLKELTSAFRLPEGTSHEKILAYAKDLMATCDAHMKGIQAMAKAAGQAGTEAFDVIVTAVTSAIAKPDASKFVPIAMFTELREKVTALTRTEIERIVDGAISTEDAKKRKLTPAQRDWAIDYLHARS
jgi:phage I-like protein